MMKERKPNRLQGYDYSSDNLYFVTSCVHNRICCFGEIVPKNPASSVGAGRDLPLQSNDHTFSIGMGRDPSLQRPKIKSLSELMGAYKTTVSKKIHLLEPTDRSRPVRTFAWQRSFYEHIIRDEKSFKTISDYILNNPINWEQDNLHIL